MAVLNPLPVCLIDPSLVTACYVAVIVIEILNFTNAVRLKYH